jgi:hypothetical protein
LQWLEKTPLALFVSQSAFGSALDMLHIAAISVVFGMIVVVDLRLLGVASKDCAVTDICRQALPWTWAAFAIAVLTGVPMFLGQSVKYYNNYAFRMKFLLMLLAGIIRRIVQDDDRHRHAARAYRGVSLAITDILGGQIPVMFADVSSIEHIRAGRLRALAVTTATRSEALPDIPTVAEFVPGLRGCAACGRDVRRNWLQSAN